MSTLKRKVKVALVEIKSKADHPTLLFNPTTRTLEFPKHEHKYPASDYIQAGYVAYELCFYSDDEIKVGDWTVEASSILSHGRLTTIDNEIELERYANGGKYNVKKVIASTDALVVESFYTSIDLGRTARYDLLPRPSKAFVEAYVKSYNKGKEITEVLVEVNERGSLKLKSEFVITHKVKEIFSKEDMLSFARWMSSKDFNIHVHGCSPQDCFDKWLEQYEED